MVLDNYLTVFNNEGEIDGLSSPTLCVGTSFPMSWLCCFIKDEAHIGEDDALLCTATVEDALIRLKHFMNILKKKDMDSKFDKSMLCEFESTYNWLKQHQNQSCRVQIYYGNYGDIISLEEFRQKCGVGVLKPYSEN